MDQGGDRRRTFHRVRQPDVERNLRRFTGGADQHQQRDGSQQTGSGLDARRELRNLVEYVRVLEGAEVLNQQEQGNEETEIADAVGDERFFPGVRRRIAQKEEANQQIGSEAHALPADEHEQVVVRQHQREHEEHEQV